MQENLHELKKIGVNYNQQTKSQNIQNKLDISGMNASERVDALMAQFKAKNDSPVQGDEAINQVAELVNRFEVAAGKLGEELWRIHG